MTNDSRDVATRVLDIYRRLPAEIGNPDALRELVVQSDELFAQLKRIPLPEDLLLQLSRECKKAQRHVLAGLDNLDREMKKNYKARQAHQGYQP